MGKLLIVIIALVLILVILPADIKNWCLLQMHCITASISDPGNGNTLADAVNNLVMNI
jgi:hypothetical protein